MFFTQSVERDALDFALFFKRGCLCAQSRYRLFFVVEFCDRNVAEVAYSRGHTLRLFVLLAFFYARQFVHVAEPHKRKYLAHRLGLFGGRLFEEFGVLALFEQVHVFKLVGFQSDNIFQACRRFLALCVRRAVFVQHAIAVCRAPVGGVAVRVLFRATFNSALDRIHVAARSKIKHHARAHARKVDHVGKIALAASAVQREHNAVENGGFSRARLAANAKQVIAPDRLEVEGLRVGKRIYAFNYQFYGFHCDRAFSVFDYRLKVCRPPSRRRSYATTAPTLILPSVRRTPL